MKRTLGYTIVTVRVRLGDAKSFCLVFLPPINPVVAIAIPTPLRRCPVYPGLADDLLLYRKGIRFPRPDGEEPEPAPSEQEKPLSATERTLYIAFAIWVGLTFLALFMLVIFMHTPGNAN